MSDMDKYINNLVSEFKRLSFEEVENCSGNENCSISMPIIIIAMQIAAKYLILFREMCFKMMSQII